MLKVLLKPEFGKEPFVLASIVPLFKFLFKLLTRSASLRRVLYLFGSANLLYLLELKSVSCWHQMVVVEHFDERFDL